MIHLLEQLRQQQIPTAPTGTEIYETGTAASIGVDEGNSIGTWGITKATIESSSSDSHDGTYSLLITGVDDVDSDYGKYFFNATDGLTYKISFWSKAGVGTTQKVSIGGFTTTVNLEDISDTVWTYREYTLVSSGTGSKNIFLYATRFGATGDTLYIDELSILEL